jgi:beta-glucosidase
VNTENGAAYDDTVGPDGVVDDQGRLDYIRSHLAAAHRAISDGVDLRGYLLWSMVDNFEWSHGYHHRFGILRVDDQLRRLPKASAIWYQAVAGSGTLTL